MLIKLSCAPGISLSRDRYHTLSVAMPNVAFVFFFFFAFFFFAFLQVLETLATVVKQESDDENGKKGALTTNVHGVIF